jgi:hypothetical protein
MRAPLFVPATGLAHIPNCPTNIGQWHSWKYLHNTIFSNLLWDKPLIRQNLELRAGTVLNKAGMDGHAPQIGCSRIANPTVSEIKEFKYFSSVCPKHISKGAFI